EGASLESYLFRVHIREDLGPYEGVDQIQIARDLLATMQLTPRYNIKLVLTEGTSGVLRDAQFLASEAASYGERLQELANVDNGFEWMIVTVDNGDGTRTRYWVWGYPHIGSDATDHKFLQPGNVLAWSESIDVRGGTAFQARGQASSEDASEEAQAPVSQVILAQDHIAAGWPGLDVTTDYSNVSDVQTLNAYARWGATHRAGATRLHEATVRLPANTTFGPGNLGDRVTLMLVNPWWPVENGVASFANACDVQTLTAYARWGATRRAGATRRHEATVRLPANATCGPGNLGDRVTLMLVNPWWPVETGVASFAKSWRVVGMTIRPPSRG